MKTHNLIESVRNSNQRSFGDDLLRQAVKFDLGSISSAGELSEISSGRMCKPPFPVSLFQFGSNSDTYMVLLVDDGTGVDAIGYGFQPKAEGVFWYKENLRVRIENYTIADGSISVFHLSSGEQVPMEWFKEDMTESWWLYWLLGIAALMEVLACSNVAWVDHPAPKLLNRKREKKGKVPIFSYKTLHIVANEGGEKSRGDKHGTHASPRVHLRRGHIRRMPSGKSVWVQPCVVGDKSRGVVHKDYAVHAA